MCNKHECTCTCTCTTREIEDMPLINPRLSFKGPPTTSTSTLSMLSSKASRCSRAECSSCAARAFCRRYVEGSCLRPNAGFHREGAGRTRTEGRPASFSARCGPDSFFTQLLLSRILLPFCPSVQVSHDEHLIQNSADEMWVASGDGRIIPWQGTFKEYKQSLVSAMRQH